MGNLERKSKKRLQHKQLRHLVLTAVATVGLLSAVLVAPNVISAMKRLGLLPSRREREFIKASRNRLIQRGYLTYEGSNLRLTPLGEREVHKIELGGFKLQLPRKWDGRWRILIFDIPERRKTLRDKVRRTLRAVGFVRLQDSVWLYPYDCEDFITLLKTDFKIGKDVLYIIADTLEYDSPYRRQFGLKLP